MGPEVVKQAAALLDINTTATEEPFVEEAGVSMSRSTLDLLIASLKRDRSMAR